MAKTPRVRGQHGWDGPVVIRLPGEVDWRNDAKTLAALIQDSVPAPWKGGTLHKDLSLRRASYSKTARGFQFVVHNSYAQIQDEGGDIPDRYPTGMANYAARRSAGITREVEGDEVVGSRVIRAMRWVGAGGEIVYRRFAKGFHITGKNFVAKGFSRWVGARGHGEQGLQVGWARGAG